MSRWGVSADAADLHADALVWDMTLPILTPGRPERKRDLFARFAESMEDAPQRPGWATRERWFPLDTSVRFGQARRVAIMVGALLLLALALAAAFVAGSRLVADAKTIVVAADGSDTAVYPAAGGIVDGPVVGEVFLMGSPADEPGRGDDEILHDVVLSYGLIAGETEVTQQDARELVHRKVGLPAVVGGVQVSAAVLTPDDRFKVIDQGADDTADSDPTVVTGLTDAFAVAASTEVENIDAGLRVDTDNDGTPDSSDECPEDVNNDDIVNIDDLFQVLAAWGPCSDCPEDLDGSGMVDIDDLFAVLAAWGPC